MTVYDRFHVRLVRQLGEIQVRQIRHADKAAWEGQHMFQYVAPFYHDLKNIEANNEILVKRNQ